MMLRLLTPYETDSLADAIEEGNPYRVESLVRDASPQAVAEFLLAWSADAAEGVREEAEEAAEERVRDELQGKIDALEQRAEEAEERLADLELDISNAIEWRDDPADMVARLCQATGRAVPDDIALPWHDDETATAGASQSSGGDGGRTPREAETDDMPDAKPTTEPTTETTEPTTTERPEWDASDLGPRQRKKFRRALNGLRSLASTWRELTGVSGTDSEGSFAYSSPLSPPPLPADVQAEWCERIRAAERAVFDQRGNPTKRAYLDHVADLEAARQRLAEELPVIDKRETAEERADRQEREREERARREELRQAEEAARKAKATADDRPRYQTVAEAARAMRAEFKRRGWSSRDISVRSDSYSMGSSIRVCIKNPDCPLPAVKRIAERYQSVSRCEMTGEILSGGNRYVNVEHSTEARRALAEPYVQPLADAIAELETLDSPNAHADIGETGMTVSRDGSGLLQLWAGHLAGMHVHDAAHGAVYVALHVLETADETADEAPAADDETEDSSDDDRAAALADNPEGVAYSLAPVWHQKRKTDVYIAVADERMPRDQFDRERERATKAGGWYSRKWGASPGGFAFASREECAAFIGGDPAARSDASA